MWKRFLAVGVGFGIALGTLSAQEAIPMPRVIADFDISDYKTIDQAVKTTIVKSNRATSPGYLGVQFDAKAKDLRVANLDPQGPAAKLLKAGDAIKSIDGKAFVPGTVREFLLSKGPGEKLNLEIDRAGKVEKITIALAKLTSPLVGNEPETPRPYLGVQVDTVAQGFKIREIVADGPAAKTDLKVGDVITKVNGKDIKEFEQLTDAYSDKRPGDSIKIELIREKKDVAFDVKLGVNEANRPKRGPGDGNWDNRQASGTFKRPSYKLAVIPISYSDIACNPKIAPRDWEEALFSEGTFTKTNVSGTPVYGSMNDYYLEQSCGKTRVEGKCFNPVKLNKKRMEYSENAARNSLYGDAIDALKERDGKDALKGFDGIFFLYAGSLATNQRGNLYWPHRSTVNHKSERWSYFICPEGGERMGTISTLAHEFGHMLGLPDLYAKPEVPGMEGVGQWCAMSNQVRNGRPQHFCAWSKEQMGWVTPTLIDPEVPQKLILAPIEGNTKECFKVLVRPDGSEYFLLEVRKKTGFDKSIPAEGLLIWRVVDGRPLLEESHGIAGPAGPQRYLDQVPYPSKANNSFTPYTVPSSESIKGNGKKVYITNIRKLNDGRVTFQIGYEFQ